MDERAGDVDPNELGGIGTEAGPGERDAQATTPTPTRGSAEPAPGDERADTVPTAAALDPELLEAGGQVPRLDALDPGESGAPAQALGTDGEASPGPGARYEGEAGGSGALVEGQRARGQEIAAGEERPAGGGPAPRGD